jgi:hypothetical protein
MDRSGRIKGGQKGGNKSRFFLDTQVSEALAQNASRELLQCSSGTPTAEFEQLRRQHDATCRELSSGMHCPPPPLGDLYLW